MALGRKRIKVSSSTVGAGAEGTPMPTRPFIPQDELTGPTPNFLLAADLVELTALFAADSQAMLAELSSALEIGQDEYENLDEVLAKRDRITVETAAEIELRGRLIGEGYPFRLDAKGAVLTFTAPQNWGQTLYVLSLILSHLPSERSPVLERAGLLPGEPEITELRRWFQSCATAAVAAEIGGDAWAFGWPRPDGSKFLDKLKAIWARLHDGDVRDKPLVGAPTKVKDDEIDIIAAKLSCDEAHGFPIILAQVASGENWRSKPLRSHADYVFYPEWFSNPPASQTLVYHVIPFVLPREQMRRETRRLGHLMHRPRLCARAYEAQQTIKVRGDLQIEGTEAFGKVDAWASNYRSRNTNGDLRDLRV
jgi:hypothetical protein